MASAVKSPQKLGSYREASLTSQLSAEKFQ